MNDTVVTVVGNVVDSPRRVRTEASAVTNFRMASTARRYDPKSEQFVDSGTLWIDVECWNDLSGNVSASISKGDPVIVHAALTTHTWESESGPRSKPRIKAFAVGPNLARGTAELKRPSRRATEPSDDAGREVSLPGGPPFPPVSAEFLRGRDYETEERTLEEVNADDLAQEPAHA